MIKPRRRLEAAPRETRAPSPAPRRRSTATEVCLGRLVGCDARGPLVEREGVRGAIPARVTTALSRATLVREAAAQREVVLLVDRDPRKPPVILGLLQPLGAPEIEARIDGRRVELEARDEIVLKCGEASITLRRNGRIAIRGVDVESRARASNRIKGGSVAIN
jgi:hypothetical protein